MSHPASFHCCLSGTVPVDPVVSRINGCLFERRLIERALELSGNICPKTNVPLTKDDLIPLKSASDAGVAGSAQSVSANEVVRPRPPNATSIPGLLSLMQNEWDALVLEAFQLKQALETTKQDLAHALYKEDAANRVIARLIKERDQARQALLQTEANVGAATARSANATQAPMDVDDGKKAPAAAAPGELPESVVNTLSETAATLSKGRKAAVKEAVAVVATPTDLQKLSVGERSHPLHSTTNPGILAVALHPTNQDLILTAGNDAQALLFNKSTGKINAHIKGHKSALTDVAFHPTSDLLFTSSVDHTANIWRNDGSGKYVVAHHLAGARDVVTKMSLHASGDLLTTSSKDGSWALYDVNGGAELKRMSGSVGLNTIQFHPDGVIVGTGGIDGEVRIFDVKSWKLATSLPKHSGPISAFTFAENGYHCASAEQSGVIKLWDLRKLTNFHTIVGKPLDDDKAGAAVSALSFDSSASYLAAAIGSRITIYAPKTFDEITNLIDHKDRVTGLAWGSQARSMISVGIDRNLKIWA